MLPSPSPWPNVPGSSEHQKPQGWWSPSCWLSLLAHYGSLPVSCLPPSGFSHFTGALRVQSRAKKGVGESKTLSAINSSQGRSEPPGPPKARGPQISWQYRPLLHHPSGLLLRPLPRWVSAGPEGTLDALQNTLRKDWRKKEWSRLQLSGKTVSILQIVPGEDALLESSLSLQAQGLGPMASPPQARDQALHSEVPGKWEGSHQVVGGF
jgi:hypothetical protein